MLVLLFGDEQPHLDHNPPLRVRAFNKRTGRYKPDANDPAHLEYRPAAPEAARSHYIKTYVRGDNGQFPDRILIKRERKRERQAIKIKAPNGMHVRTFGWRDPRPKQKIPQRRNPWPTKGSRKMRGRQF